MSKFGMKMTYAVVALAASIVFAAPASAAKCKTPGALAQASTHVGVPCVVAKGGDWVHKQIGKPLDKLARKINPFKKKKR